MNKDSFNKHIADGYNHIPVYRTLDIDADTDTALNLYLKLANTPYSYLFESVEGGKKWGRYSMIGLHAQTIVKVSDYDVRIECNGELFESSQVKDPLVWIEQYLAQYKVPQLEALPDFNGGLVGYFGYEIIRYIEPKLAKINKPDEMKVPDILLMLSNDLVVFDNVLNQAFVITHIDPNTQKYEDAQIRLDEIITKIQTPFSQPAYQSDHLSGQDFVSSFGEDKYKAAVEKIQEYIVAGDVMQVVPSQRLSAKFSAPPIEFYRQLRCLNPSPYMYYLNLDDVCIVGSSPEILTRVDSNRCATVRPLAGTRPRGKDEAQDLALEKDLLADEKEIAEHLMLIDLGRNDLGRIAKIGSVKVTNKMYIERYSHVMHIASNVECELQENMSAIDVLKATFPAGTLSGAPKVRAMEIINEVEPVKRNIYSGAIGHLSWHGCMDMAIAIRTAVIKNETLYVQAGAGIVYDSDPQSEWNETLHKANAIIKAVEKV
ncbi:Anthranilate synthase, aminase component (EC 4.1.3.27) [uncultured Gammaproteobacteria bacterium]|jgi:anthranilate synthase component 1|nr:Anthranilate synthase, aminase component (EC 4.1.3.27) [uncultured Gammaproteobacteria bacterium]CAC9605096.1 Anthranilate synthase, aminase component (EC 4.1.3.27) [uncultured Gammaproteobacteria bacterium]CAC9629160.1 Anthranilate synthase, aminase component (EC 4.1.3.27) [uncultured Gammaproteobacteria bacterium]CAC9991961.1 Anthranilate synthase, aminase component (EC 4.1.3.27) [uncultured Gammaproteobacteria bacterium]